MSLVSVSVVRCVTPDIRLLSTTLSGSWTYKESGVYRDLRVSTVNSQQLSIYVFVVNVSDPV